MKRLRIYPSHLETRAAEFPVGNKFSAIKLSFKEAMNFTSKDIKTFDDLLVRYGLSNQLRIGEFGEFYNGYVAVFLWYGETQIVAMRGQIRPKVVSDCPNDNLADKIRRGQQVWECVYPLGKGRFGQGTFKYVWTFRDCAFAQHIVWGKEHGWLGYEDLDAEVIDKTLKDKIIAALQKEDKIVELTNVENAVLMNYLGEDSYYKRFFVEVK